MSNTSRDLAYIRDPMLWVQLFAPLKRRVNPMQFAYMTGDGPNIYIGNMFDFKPTDKKVEYPSYEAIVADGWVVD